MNLLTDLPEWAWVTIMLLVDVLAVSLLMAHEQRQQQKLLRSEKKRLEDWAESRAEQLADARFTELIISEKIRTKDR